MQEIGAYIHIPFCIKKCYYCDFISYENEMQKVDDYIECLKKEIQNEKNKSLDNFIKLLGQSVAATQEKISKIMQEEENILTELQNKVEKK